MKKLLTMHGQVVRFQERMLVSAVRKAIPYLLGLGLGLSTVQTAYGVSGESSAAFTATQLVRQFTLKNTVAQVSMGMQGLVTEVNGEQRAPGMGERPAGFPLDMGSVPAAANLPRRDGAGRPLGYCAWDNASSVTTATHNAGLGVANPLVYAVVSPGLNGSMQTTCADILATGVGVGDDYVQVVAAMAVSSASYKSSVSTFANLPAGEEGDIRLVRDSNKLYSYDSVLGWKPVQAGPFEADASGGAGAIAYTTGKVTVADFQATTATLTGALTGTSATFSGALTANTLTGNGSGLTDLNASNFTSGVVSPQFGGTGVNGAAAANGTLLIGNGSGYSLGTLTAGTGIGVLNGAGSITISNTGVTSLAGTANQVNVSASTGAVTLSLPQDIATTSTPTFGGMMLNGGLMGTTATFSGGVTVDSLTAQRLNIGTSAGGVTNPNLIIGNGAMPGTQSGSGANTAVGISALASNTTGFSNTATGLRSMMFNTIGHGNSAVGYQTLYNNTTGIDNVAMGYASGLGNTIGSANTSLGGYAGMSNVSGSRNTFLGYSADSVTGALSYATAIGADSRVATSNTIALGRNSTADQVVIGTDTRNDTYANTKLYVNGVTNLNGDLRGTTATFSGGGAATPQVLAGSSTANYIALLGNASAGAYNPNTQAGDNVIFFSNGAINTGRLVLAPWTSSEVAMRMTTAGTTFNGGVTVDSIGAQRLNLGTNAGGVAFQNVIIGNNAMPGAQGGDGGNTAIGQSVLTSNTSGSFNTATGLQALLYNTTGFNNNATGVNALISNTTGYGNVAMGRDALVANTTGAYNTGLGQSAGYINTAGNFNTFLGFGATSTTGALSYATAIGADSTVATSNTIALGRNSTADQVVIGTDSRNDSVANTKLFVNGNTHFNGAVQVASAVNFNEVLGDKLNLWGGYGFGINNSNLTAYIPGAGQRFSVRTGGNFNGTEVFSVSGAGNMYLAGSMVSDLNVSQGYALKFAHGNQLDGNDGKIGAGLFAEGLNIIGVQTNPGAGRKVSVFGDMNLYGNFSANQISANSIATTSLSTNSLSVNGSAAFTGSLNIPTNQAIQFGGVFESTDPVAIHRVSYTEDRTALRIIIGDNLNTFGTGGDELQVGVTNLGDTNLFAFTPTFRVAGNGDVIASGYVQATAFNVSSDRRLKNNIAVQDTDSMLDRLGKINTYSYGYTANPEIGRRIGVIAQELQSLFPEAVATRADGMLSVDYNALGAMAAAGVGQLNKKFIGLDKKVTEQGEKLTQLDAKVSGHNTRIEALEGWKTDAVARMDNMQSAIDLNIQKIADNAVAIQTNAKAIERLDDALLTLDGTVKGNTEAIGNINARWARNFSASEDGSLLTVNAVELKVSNFTTQKMRANSVYTQRLEAEIAKIAELEVNNLRTNSAVANTVQAEQVNTGSVQVYAGVGMPALLFAAKADGHYTVSTSALDGSYATATVIVNAGQAQVIPAASKGIELMAEGNMVKVIAAGKTIKASWIKMG